MNHIKRVEEFTPNQLRSLVTLYDYAQLFGTYQDIIMEVGYNSNSGYVYIDYEGGYSIAIFEGRTEEKDVIVFAFHPVTGEELEFDDIDLYFEWLDEQSERIHNSY